MTPEEFRDHVVGSLSRIETAQTHVEETVRGHGVRITGVEGKLGRVMASVAFIGTAAGALGHWALVKLGLA